MDPVIGPQTRSVLDDRVILQATARADFHVRFDDAEGTDDHIVGQFRSRAHDGQRMDIGHDEFPEEHG
jgi:hypothetical protein